MRPKADARASFRKALTARRLVIVAGGPTQGRTVVAAAVAAALARLGPTLLVDADDPQHRLSECFVYSSLTSDMKTEELPKPVPVRVGPASADLRFARLSRAHTHEFLERLMATRQWRKMMLDDGGSIASAVGMPLEHLVGIIDCLRPLPGAEMPVALARLLASESARGAKHVVVDAGAAGLAAQFQSIPPVVADGLSGLLQMQELVASMKDMVPGAFSAGVRMLVGQQVTQSAREQFRATTKGMADLRSDLAHLVGMGHSVLLVAPRRPSIGGVQGNLRMVERLQPSCMALGWNPADGSLPADAPPWAPPGLATVTLPSMAGVGGTDLSPDEYAALVASLADLLSE